MKKLLVTCFLVLIGIDLRAQGTIAGLVTTPEKEPAPFATVSVSQRTTAITATVSDREGRFAITNLPNGVYQLTVALTGFDLHHREFVIGNLNKNLDFGHLTLQRPTVVMREMTVTGKQLTLTDTLEKKSFSAADMITSAAGSALDAMRQLPGVTIDQESKVQLRGSDKVAILIDGKQSAVTGFGAQKGLGNIPASQIDFIEIINNPSAKYDAAGMAGIVNIVLKPQQKTGLHGEVGFSFGMGQLTRRRADLPTSMPSYARNAKYSPSLSLNYKTTKLNLFLQSSWLNQEKLPNNEFSTRYYPNGDMVESQVAENRQQDHYDVKAGFDWYLADNQTLTVFGLYDYEWHIDTSKVWYFENRKYDTPTRKWGFRESEGTGLTNFTVQHKFRFVQPGHELNSQYLYTKGWEDETYNLYQDATMRFPAISGDRTAVLAPEYVHQLNSDYLKPLPFGRLEAGLQARFRRMPITYTTTRSPGKTALLFDFGKWSNWNEDLTAGYLNLVSEFKHWDVEAGLRGEYTKVGYKFAPNQYFRDDYYDYFKPFPNVRLTLRANQNNALSLFFNRRIDRPGEDILRIFPKYDDPELLKIGNPKLRPQLTNALDLAYRLNWAGGSFYAATYYKEISNHYTRIYIQDPTHPNITVKGYSNVPKATNTGLEVNFDQNVTKVWKLNLSGNLYRNSIRGYSGQIDFPTPVTFATTSQRDTPWYIKSNHLLTLSSRVKCEVGGSYFSSKATAQGAELSRWGVNFGLRTLWLKNALEVNLTATDLFNQMGLRTRVNQGGGYSTFYQNFYETQVFSLNSKYKF